MLDFESEEEMLRELEFHLLPSPNSVSLVGSAISDYRSRGWRTVPHVAEVYHFNSWQRLGADTREMFDGAVAVARRWFLEQTFTAVAEEAAPPSVLSIDDLDERATALLRQLHVGCEAGLAFAVDTIVVAGEKAVRWIPGTLCAIDLGSVDTLALELNTAGVAVAFVGVFWRYMAIIGPRGYRQTLLDAGRLTQAALGGLPGSRVAYSFNDDAWAKQLGIDGVERGVVSLVVEGRR